MSINRVVISGNLTRDPEIRSAQNSGVNILTFGVAVNDRRRNPQTGEWEDYANFIDCVLFGNRADYLSRTLHKGTKVVVEGKLRYSTWERDGQRRSKIEVVVDDVDFVSPRQQGYDGNQAYGAQGQAPQGQYAPRNQYQSQGQGYAAPAPQQAAPAQMGAAQGQPTYAVPAPAPQAAAPAPMPAQGTTAPRPVVTTPPDTEVYDEDIPF